MSTLSGFTWPRNAKTKRSSPSSPILISDHRPLIIGLAVAGAVTSIVLIYTVFFFILKWRKLRAAKQSKDIESEGKIELQDNDPSPGVRKENGKLDFVEVDLGEEKSKE
ncbi:uncharacterized protein J4E84_002548 [Alternaria hordeiaustralica]|uniref:uncharacterized protein n=1 Tax=Alternaria hordeiaustralica TaxID=1187925 RepID=UPI0020C327B0|nr:uncharacterized protein J4E84_002548 [Alternaria hordeiaustralica]KAI4693969.1 hypothetical protein J4E84_002548 [Alternaria hordeiaustralica]